MPFIGGRYYANALAGHAIEAARAAEAAALALKTKAAQKRNASAGGADDAGPGANSGSGEYENPSGDPADAYDVNDAPIHRVEIEAAELVPSRSGRAQRGFVARVHRDPGAASDAAGGSVSAQSPLPGQMPARGYAPKPETHVFAGHGDLLDFLKTELGKGAVTSRD